MLGLQQGWLQLQLHRPCACGVQGIMHEVHTVMIPFAVMTVSMAQCMGFIVWNGRLGALNHVGLRCQVLELALPSDLSISALQCTYRHQFSRHQAQALRQQIINAPQMLVCSAMLCSADDGWCNWSATTARQLLGFRVLGLHWRQRHSRIENVP
jgi:hypothetical protein